MNKLRILVVHEVGYLSNLVYEFQILSEALSLLGHQVTVIDYEDSWQGENGRPVFDLSTRVFRDVHRAYAEASVTVRRPGMVRIPLLSRVSGAVTNGIELFRHRAIGQTDGVLLYGVPTVGMQALAAARRYGVPVLFRSIDVSHKIAPRPLSYPTWWIERYVYNHADAVSALPPRLKTYIESFGVPSERIQVTPSGVDLEMFSSGPRSNDLLARWGIGSEDKVALFMGTLYRFSGLERVIRDLAAVSGEPKVHLLIVGHGEDEERLRTITADTGASGFVKFTGLQPYSLLPDFIRSSDVCLNPFELNAVTRDILPTKLFQYLACGKPLLATKLPGTEAFLEGEEQGVVYASGETFVRRLRELVSDPARCRELGRRGEEAMKERYGWRKIAGEIASSLEQLVQKA